MHPTLKSPSAKRLIGLFTDVLFVFALVIVLVAAVIYAGLQFYGIRFYEVTSTSMSGTFEKGDVVGVKAVVPYKVKDGDIIAFTNSRFSEPIIHRVEAVGNPAPDIITVVRNRSGRLLSERWSYAHRDFYTKGDANPTVDHEKVPQEDLVGKFQFVVPKPFNLLVTRTDRSSLMVLGVGAIVAFILWELFDGAKEVLKRRQGRALDADVAG